MKHNLLALRAVKGWTQEQAADAMGVSRSHYVKLERGERGLTGHMINMAAKAFEVPAGAIIDADERFFQKYPEIFEEPRRTAVPRRTADNDVEAAFNRQSGFPEYYPSGPAFEANKKTALAWRDRLVPIPVAGRAEAGTFREVDDITDMDFEPEFIFDEPDPDFPNARMFAVSIQGDSMNAAHPPLLEGYRMICVSFDDAMVPLSDGMTVLVQRSRDGGLTREWSVKEVEMGDDTISFCPRSTNPKHKPIVIPLNPDPTDGVTVEVIGIGRRISASIPRFRRR